MKYTKYIFITEILCVYITNPTFVLIQCCCFVLFCFVPFLLTEKGEKGRDKQIFGKSIFFL